jgi:hypothetical protein
MEMQQRKNNGVVSNAFKCNAVQQLVAETAQKVVSFWIWSLALAHPQSERCKL